jgi:hypothetical protein
VFFFPSFSNFEEGMALDVPLQALHQLTAAAAVNADNESDDYDDAFGMNIYLIC